MYIYREREREREREGEGVWWEEAQMGSASKGAPLKVLVGSPSRVAPLKCQEQPCCTYVHVKCMHAPMELMLALLLQQPQVHHIYIHMYMYIYMCMWWEEAHVGSTSKVACGSPRRAAPFKY